MTANRYQIDMPQPPHDWADPPSEWEYDVNDGMHVSAMAIVALLAMALGLGLGYLIWS